MYHAFTCSTCRLHFTSFFGNLRPFFLSLVLEQKNCIRAMPGHQADRKDISTYFGKRNPIRCPRSARKCQGRTGPRSGTGLTKTGKGCNVQQIISLTHLVLCNAIRSCLDLVDCQNYCGNTSEPQNRCSIGCRSLPCVIFHLFACRVPSLSIHSVCTTFSGKLRGHDRIQLMLNEMSKTCWVVPE